jgi:hypothetical protein
VNTTNTVTFRYVKGQHIPEHVIRALVFTGKVGFLTFDTWANCFAVGTDRWKRMQFDYLRKEGYFAYHRYALAYDILVLGPRGKEIVDDVGGTILTSPPVGHLIHDGVVAKSLQRLDAQKLLHTWVVERQLKRDGVKEYLISTKEDNYKYPDAVFKIHAFEKLRVVAFEYERERKAMSRYRAILWQYASLTNVSMVLFVCEKPNIKTTIESAMTYLGQTALTDRLAFADAADWKRDPLTAPIHLGGSVIELGKICVPNMDKLAA